jgi:hypothetical protein
MANLLARIDAAIDRLRSRFGDGNVSTTLAISIVNLQEKRQRVIDGTYRPDEDADRLVAMLRTIGAGICENTKARESWYVGSPSVICSPGTHKKAGPRRDV